VADATGVEKRNTEDSIRWDFSQRNIKIGDNRCSTMPKEISLRFELVQHEQG